MKNRTWIHPLALVLGISLTVFFPLTEQGAGINNNDDDNTSRYVNRKYTFKALLYMEQNNGAVGAKGTYIPLTMRALRDETVKDPYITYYSHADGNKMYITSPISGKRYCNWRVNSTTVTVTDAECVGLSMMCYTLG